MEFFAFCLLGGFVPGCLFFGILHELRKSEKQSRDRQGAQR